MKLLAKYLSVGFTAIFLFVLFANLANAQGLTLEYEDLTIGQTSANNPDSFYWDNSNFNAFYGGQWEDITRIDFLFRDTTTIPNPVNLTCLSDSQYDTSLNFVSTGDTVSVSADTYEYWSLDQSQLNDNCTGWQTETINHDTFRASGGENAFYYRFFYGSDFVRTPVRIYTGSLIIPPLKLFLFVPEGEEVGFSATMTASVIQGVQQTGINIWPLFVFAGVPLAFIIALQLVVFTRRAVGVVKK